MATPDLAALQAQVEKLKRDYTALTNKPAALFDVSNPIKAAAAVKSLTDQIELATQRAARLEEGFGGIFDEVTAIVAELYKTQQPIDLASKAMKGIRNVTEKLKYDQQGISEMSLKELKNSQKKLESLQEQVRTQANAFIISKGLQNSSGLQLENYLNASIAMGSITEEQAAMVRGAKETNVEGEKGFLVFKKINKELNDRLKLEKKVQSDLGITGGLLKGISKIPIIGDMFDASDAVEEMEAHLREVDKDGKQINSNTSALKVGLKNVKGQIIDGLLNPANLIVGAFTLMLEALQGADKGAGDLAKGFNMTYNEAMNVREQLTQMGNSSMDVALNTRALQESMMAVGQALGSNAMLNEKDLITFTKLREQAGFTNEELLGIEKTTLATGGNLEENAKNILYSAKLTGLNNKVLLNEKDIMRDVAKASDATKLSLGGSGKKLGEAAAQAKALGMNLEQVDKIAGSLLDFESSITNELSAELITGKQLNLEQARLYALNNDMAGLSREIAKNFGSVAEFSKMNRIQQEAAAKAVGMSREELATTLTDQAALKGLSGDKLKDAQASLDLARAQGMTEDQIAKQGVNGLMKQQSVQDRLNNSVEKLKEIFVSIAEPIMQIISPFVNILIPIISKIPLLLQPVFDIFNGISGILTLGFDKLNGWTKVMGIIGLTAAGILIVTKSIAFYNGLIQAFGIAQVALERSKKQGILGTIGSMVVALGIQMGILSASMATNAAVTFGIGVAIAVAAALAGIAAIRSVATTPVKMATGGQVPPGYENDTYPALLSSGETVITKPMTSALNNKNSYTQQSQLIDHDKMAASIARAMSNQPVHVTSTVDGNVLTKAVGKRSDLLGTTLKTNVYQTS
jgi:hypothetical protein